MNLMRVCGVARAAMTACTAARRAVHAACGRWWRCCGRAASWYGHFRFRFEFRKTYII